MAKNRTFENVYQVTVAGKTTNGSIASFIHKMLFAAFEAFGRQFAQATVTVEIVSTKGDFNAVTGEIKED